MSLLPPRRPPPALGARSCRTLSRTSTRMAAEIWSGARDCGSRKFEVIWDARARSIANPHSLPGLPLSKLGSPQLQRGRPCNWASLCNWAVAMPPSDRCHRLPPPLAAIGLPAGCHSRSWARAVRGQARFLCRVSGAEGSHPVPTVLLVVLNCFSCAGAGLAMKNAPELCGIAPAPAGPPHEALLSEWALAVHPLGRRRECCRTVCCRSRWWAARP